MVIDWYRLKEIADDIADNTWIHPDEAGYLIGVLGELSEQLIRAQGLDPVVLPTDKQIAECGNCDHEAHWHRVRGSARLGELSRVCVADFEEGSAKICGCQVLSPPGFDMATDPFAARP